MPPTPEDRALDAFAKAFGGEPTSLGRAPGRVELAGQPYRLQRRPGPGRRDRPVDRGRRSPPTRAPGPGRLGQPRRGRRVPRRRAPAGLVGRDLGPLRPGGDLGDGPRRTARSARASRPPWPATSRSAPGCPARRACRPPSPYSWPARGSRDVSSGPGPIPTPRRTDAPGPDLATVRERVRRGRLGPARPVLEPLRQGRAGIRARLPIARVRPRPARRPPRRRSWSATRRPPGGWPTACTTAGGPNASGWSPTSRRSDGCRLGPPSFATSSWST